MTSAAKKRAPSEDTEASNTPTASEGDMVNRSAGDNGCGVATSTPRRLAAVVGHVQLSPAASGERPLGSQHRRALSMAPSELGDRVSVAVECEGEPASLVPRREQGLSATGGRSRRPRRDPDRDRIESRRNGCDSTTAYEPDTIGWASPW